MGARVAPRIDTVSNQPSTMPRNTTGSHHAALALAISATATTTPSLSMAILAAQSAAYRERDMAEVDYRIAVTRTYSRIGCDQIGQ